MRARKSVRLVPSHNINDMEKLSREHIRRVVNTIWTQLVGTTSPDVIGSWGLSSLSATQMVKRINGSDLTMAALILTVEGFCFQGQVYVALDEGSDYYRIYFKIADNLEEKRADVAFDELGSVLDSLIESGGMSKQEYEAKIEEEYNLKVISV